VPLICCGVAMRKIKLTASVSVSYLHLERHIYTYEVADNCHLRFGTMSYDCFELTKFLVQEASSEMQHDNRRAEPSPQF
jgi:hypothetical protein